MTSRNPCPCSSRHRSAWKELGELSCEESRAAYVSFVDEFFPEWEEAAARGERGKSKAGTEDSTDDELGDDSDSGGGDSSEGAGSSLTFGFLFAKGSAAAPESPVRLNPPPPLCTDLGPTQSTLLGRMREDGELPSDDGEGSLHAIVQQDDPEVLDRALELATEAQISEGDDAVSSAEKQTLECTSSVPAKGATPAVALCIIECHAALCSQGMTPLHWASDHGSVACAQVLLRAGAKVNVQVSENDMLFATVGAL